MGATRHSRPLHHMPGLPLKRPLCLPQVNTLNTLDEVGLTEKTVIIRTADHGEMGMAHGTLIQKNFNMSVGRVHCPVLHLLLLL